MSREPVRSEGRPTGHPGAHAGRPGPHGNPAQRHQTGRPHVTAVREAPPHWLAAGSSGRQAARLLSPWRPAVLWTVPGPPDPCPLAGALPLPASGRAPSSVIPPPVWGLVPCRAEWPAICSSEGSPGDEQLCQGLWRGGWPRVAPGWVVTRALLGWATQEWPRDG